MTQLLPESGFFELESIRDAPRHRVWYAFAPADEAPDDAPLFMFFNGGPGYSTGILFGLNTGGYTLDPEMTGSEPIASNASAWTRAGNLLWVDAPGTGFSYPVPLEDGSKPSAGCIESVSSKTSVRTTLSIKAWVCSVRT